MMKLFQKLAEDIRRFIEQRDDLVLVVECKGQEASYILKQTDAVEQENGSDLFWMFAADFREPAAYVTRLAEDFDVKAAGVRAAQAEEGLPPWPPLPGEVMDPKLPPVARLKALMVFARSLLPAPEGHLMVWGMLPLDIRDAEAYGLLMSALIVHDAHSPWCHHMRIMVRDDASAPVLKRDFKQARRVRRFKPDFSQKALEKSLEDEAGDDQLPLPHRLQTLMLLAGADFSHGRLDESLAKYELMLKYYLATANHTMSALVLNGIGEVHEKKGDDKKAKYHYESALVPAMESKAQPVLLNIVLNLANLMQRYKVWPEAESYFDSADKLAASMLNAPIKLQVMENLGYCRYQQGKVKDGIRTWEDGAQLGKAVEEPALRKRHLDRLADHYRSVGDEKRLQAVLAETGTA